MKKRALVAACQSLLVASFAGAGVGTVWAVDAESVPAAAPAGTALALAAAAADGTEDDPESPRGAVEALLSTVEVTATKKATTQDVQEVPIAMTAYGADQLEALKVRDLQGLSFSAPNVALDDIGTFKGTANFSIRGLGVNSSIPSVDPTVGVFVDGVYLGINAGVVFDMFDVESIEILRGPQGLLFGRNVTGGAVLINTKRPDPDGEASARVATESGFRGTGLNHYAMGSVSGSLGADLAAKLAVYSNRDDGWHENLFDGRDFGGAETFLFRPVLMYTPSDAVELLLRYEHGETEGDGPAAQNRAFFDRNSFDFAVDEPGFFDNSWDQLTFEGNWDVGFGGGRVTNIVGWRQYESIAVSDIDALDDRHGIPVPFLFHAVLGVDQEQISNELRYAGSFGDNEITAGLYYFEQELKYQESRYLPVAAALQGADFSGGGIQDQSTWGVFAQLDRALSDSLTLTVGARWSVEDKDVRIASLNANLRVPSVGEVIVPVRPGGCNVLTGDCSFDFVDSDDWSAFSPKLGLSWKPNEQLQVYGYWTRGFRSGGYNLRNTSPTTAPGPYDQETQSAFEVGFKYQPEDRSLRWNTAVFYNEIDDLQREINLTDPTAGVVQIIRNTADATIHGFETELQFLIGSGFALNASLGYTHGEYDAVRFDLNGDGQLSAADRALDLPRLAPWTYAFGASYDYLFDSGALLTWRLGFSHRDGAAYTDNNRGTLNAADMVDAGITYLSADDRWQLSLYGKNLLDEVTEGGDTQLPFPRAGATFSPLNKGRVIGLEATLRF